MFPIQDQPHFRHLQISNTTRDLIIFVVLGASAFLSIALILLYKCGVICQPIGEQRLRRSSSKKSHGSFTSSGDGDGVFDRMEDGNLKRMREKMAVDIV